MQLKILQSIEVVEGNAFIIHFWLVLFNSLVDRCLHKLGYGFMNFDSEQTTVKDKEKYL